MTELCMFSVDLSLALAALPPPAGLHVSGGDIKVCSAPGATWDSAQS